MSRVFFRTLNRREDQPAILQIHFNLPVRPILVAIGRTKIGLTVLPGNFTPLHTAVNAAVHHAAAAVNIAVLAGGALQLAVDHHQHQGRFLPVFGYMGKLGVYHRALRSVVRIHHLRRRRRTAGLKGGAGDSGRQRKKQIEGHGQGQYLYHNGSSHLWGCVLDEVTWKKVPLLTNLSPGVKLYPYAGVVEW